MVQKIKVNYKEASLQHSN